MALKLRHWPVLVAIIIAAAPARAADGIEVGQLTCGVKGGVSFIIGSTKELRCLFRVSANDAGERYEGKIEKFGLDVGVTDKTLLTWTVFAPTAHVEAGSLAGKYIGVAADASVGLGGGANVLVGGSNNTIALQPLSVQGQTGLNAALAIASVELVPFEDLK